MQGIEHTSLLVLQRLGAILRGTILEQDLPQAKAVSYIELKKPDGEYIFGIGIDSNVNIASVLGVLNAINRAEA